MVRNARREDMFRRTIDVSVNQDCYKRRNLGDERWGSVPLYDLIPMHIHGHGPVSQCVIGITGIVTRLLALSFVLMNESKALQKTVRRR
jgi:hypothetical protein